MWRERHYVKFNGKSITVRALADAFGVPYDACLSRYRRGYRDPWKVLFGPEGKPVEFTLTEEQRRWLQDTRWAREGQEPTRGSGGHRDGEWEIACDLIGVPRAFAENLKEAMG